jgi:hypothetical protein
VRSAIVDFERWFGVFAYGAQGSPGTAVGDVDQCDSLRLALCSGGWQDEVGYCLSPIPDSFRVFVQRAKELAKLPDGNPTTGDGAVPVEYEYLRISLVSSKVNHNKRIVSRLDGTSDAE